MIHVQFHNLRRRLLAGRAEFGRRGIFDLAVRHYRRTVASPDRCPIFAPKLLTPNS